MKFSGFDDYIEIFKGGTQTDNRGRTHDGDTMIDKALAGFDPADHEPPLCVGHPKDNAPAFGWVEDLKETVKGGTRYLLAKFKDVVPEFADLARQGVYKKRSASFYPDGRLRHVGFLGAAPPAVKGLADIGFDDDGNDAIEFESQQPTDNGIEPLYTETQTKGVSMKFSEFLNAINLFKKSGGKDEDIDLIAPTVATAPHTGGEFTEADLETARKEAAAEAKKQAQAEFAEAEAKRHKDERAGRIKQFCEDGVKAGKIAPAWIKAGMAQFMEQLAFESASAIEFCQGSEKKTPDAWFKEFLEGLPKLVEFSEIAARGKDIGDDGDVEKREKLISDFMESEKVDYKEAVLAVSKKHPDLFPRP